MRPRDRRHGGFGARPRAATAASISARRMVRRSGEARREGRHRRFRRTDRRRRRAGTRLRQGGARGRTPCRDRQQGAACQAWRRACRDRREKGRAAELRSGGRRRHSGDQDDARGDGRQHGQPRVRHPQRHLQLHPDPHGGRGPVLRRLPEGCAAAGLCRSRPDLRHRGPRHGAQALHPDRACLRHADLGRRHLYGRHFQHLARPTSAPPANSATGSSCSASPSAPRAASSSACIRPWCRRRR